MIPVSGSSRMTPPKDDDRLDAEGDDQTGGQQLPEVIRADSSRCAGLVATSTMKQSRTPDGAHQTELFADHREDEVGLGLWDQVRVARDSTPCRRGRRLRARIAIGPVGTPRR